MTPVGLLILGFDDSEIGFLFLENGLERLYELGVAFTI